MNLKSLISYCLPCIPEPYTPPPSQTDQPISLEHSPLQEAAYLAQRGETNNNTFWEGKNVNEMTPLPDCTHTSLSLKSLELQNTTCSSSKTAWDQAKSSGNIHIVSGEPTKLHRHPIARSTDIAMTDTGFSKGIHVLEVEWPTTMRGTHAVIGVALEGMPSNGVGYTNLLGSTGLSWGWDIKNHKLLHNGESFGNYPKDKSDEAFTVPEKISCIIDMNAGTIGFKVDEEYLGDAFSGLKPNKVYLAVSAVWGHAEIKVQYITGEQAPTPLSLQALSKLSLRNLVKYEEQLSGLPTAPPLMRFIADKDDADIDH